jgi:hypothetical protein
MRPIHESDCDFQIIGICTCGALNKCRRLAGGSAVPGMAEHEANIRKLRDLQAEKPAPPLVPSNLAEQTPPIEDITDPTRPYIDPRSQRPTRGHTKM